MAIEIFGNRKGQFYIFGAIILCLLAYSIYSNQSRVQFRTGNDFKMLCSEFIRESAFVIDNAVYNQVDINSQVSNFTDYFIKYARTKKRGFGIFYILLWNERLYLRNNISSLVSSENRNLSVTFFNSTSEWNINLKNEHVENAGGINKLRAALDSTYYDFDIDGRNIEFKILFVSEGRNETNTYLHRG